MPLTHGVRASACPRRLAKEGEQADAAQQGEGQLDLHHELCQAGGGLKKVHQLFGGKEAMSLFSPPRRVQDGSSWSCGVYSKHLVVTS